MAERTRGAERPHPAASPNVRVPPPFVFVAGWVAAWLLHQRLPFEIDGGGASMPQQAVGIVLLASGLTLMGWALATFARARTPIVPVRPARVLVRTGPFRFSRNPMYVGMTAAYVGLAVLVNQAWPILFLPTVLIVLLFGVIRREERHLHSAFPDEYAAYCRRVRRWL